MIKRSSKKTKFILSVIALAEVLILAAGITFSWIEGGDKGYIEGNEIVINSGSNLTMMQDGKSVNTITIPTCTLEETSSSDGRNFFFPMADNTTNVTNSMTFREGTPADRNTKYISLDFQIIASTSNTDVFLSPDTFVKSNNDALNKALRMSFTFNDNSAPIVFNPTQSRGDSSSYKPVTQINGETGVATNTPTTATKAFGDYCYFSESSTPVFHLESSETLNVTLSIWLEGTEFTSDDIQNQNLSIYIGFTTTPSVITVYATNQDYGDNDDEYYMYVYDGDKNKLAGDWPGTAMTKDPVTGYYKYEILSEETIYVIVNNNNKGLQYPTSGGLECNPGKSYIINNSTFKEYNS